jgi:hypothetical protein
MRIWPLPLLLTAFSLFVPPAALAEAAGYATLKSAESFAIGGVGVAGTTTKQELAMRALRDAPDGEQQLRKLLHEGTPAGQMYALFGLRQRGAADYKELAQPFRQHATPVQVISGCVIHTDAMSVVVGWIDQWATKVRTSEKP